LEPRAFAPAPNALLSPVKAWAPSPTAVVSGPLVVAWQSELDSKLVAATLPELHPAEAGEAIARTIELVAKVRHASAGLQRRVCDIKAPIFPQPSGKGRFGRQQSISPWPRP
jgi:hypothetical protein